jgi:hypothetical protein
VELRALQILVVVATNQMRTLMTDGEKGSMGTSFVHGIVVPKEEIYLSYTSFACLSERVLG